MSKDKELNTQIVKLKTANIKLDKQVAELKKLYTEQIAGLRKENNELAKQVADFTRLHKDWLAEHSDSRFYAAEVARVLGCEA